jgi:hypothetical protein
MVDDANTEKQSLDLLISAECYTFKPLNLHMLSS